jgi:hypothetical protein
MLRAVQPEHGLVALTVGAEVRRHDAQKALDVGAEADRPQASSASLAAVVERVLGLDRRILDQQGAELTGGGLAVDAPHGAHHPLLATGFARVREVAAHAAGDVDALADIQQRRLSLKKR